MERNQGFQVWGKLNIAEYVSLAGSIFGSLAAITSQQVVYAAAPLTVALSLSLANRQRFQTQTQAAIASITETVKSLDAQVKLLPNAQHINDFEAAILSLSAKSVKLEQAVNEKSAELTTAIHAFERQAEDCMSAHPQIQQNLDNLAQTTLLQLEVLPDRIAQLQTEMRSLQAQIQQQHQQDEAINKKVENLQLRFQLISYLSREIGKLKLQQKQNRTSIQSNDTPQPQPALMQIESLQQQLQTISTENQQLRAEMSQHALNSFERAILNCLQQGLPQQIILPQFDAGTGRNHSMFIDFVVIMNNCTVVIEAKSYKGKIAPLWQETRNSSWICRTENQTISINCCWGRNPYQQVNTYVNSLRQVIQARSQNQFPSLPVYGIVVFPTGSEIDYTIESNLGEYYQVTTLTKLLNVIRSFERQAQARNTNNISYRNVVNIVTGSRARQAA